MKALRTSIAPIGLAMALSSAIQAQEVTYDFSGAVTVVSGLYGSIPLGSQITGTYTFDLANANPAQSSGTVGSPTAPWDRELFGGSYYISAPTPVHSVVFSSTASVDGFTYTSAAPSNYLTFSRVLTVGPPISSAYQTLELICLDSTACHSSALFGNDLFGINYTSAGLPDFSASPNGWSGEFATGPQFGSADFLRFSINSLVPMTTPVPEPATTTLVALGAVGFWLARRRKPTRGR
jgi:hypothetical protein